MNNIDELKIAIAQISPVWLNKEKTIEKIKTSIIEAAAQNCDLVVFGEALLPGYPHYKTILENAPKMIASGGSCIAGPDGEWLVEPVIDSEELIIQTINFNRVLEERQNFDPVGHYSRPDVTSLTINRERHSVLNIIDK